MREVCYLFLTGLLPMLLDRKDRLSMAVGIEVRVPFCDHRLVEYVFGTSWAHKTFDRREKSLLRAAAIQRMDLEFFRGPATDESARIRARHGSSGLRDCATARLREAKTERSAAVCSVITEG